MGTFQNIIGDINSPTMLFLMSFKFPHSSYTTSMFQDLFSTTYYLSNEPIRRIMSKPIRIPLIIFNCYTLFKKVLIYIF